jgi:hypothetical protein
MSDVYGFKITGEDTSPFTVLDTELDTLSLVVTETGRASSITLDYPLQSSDFVFVKSPSAPGNTNFTGQSDYPAPNTSLYFPGPQYYYMSTDRSGTNHIITFHGNAYDYYADPYNPRGLPRIGFADGWDVEFDYFIVRRSTDIVSQGIGRDDNYGIQIRSKYWTEENPILSYDSRSAISNDTFTVETYLPPATQVYQPGNSEPAGYSTLNFTSGCYVNINWTDRLYNSTSSERDIGFIQAMGINSTTAWAVTGFIGMEDGGRFFLDGNSSAILAVRLRDLNNLYNSNDQSTSVGDDDDTTTAPSDDDVETNYTGSLSYVAGNTFTEGGTIQFDASVNTPNVGYHTKIFRVTGSGNDLDSITHTFTGTSSAERISITASNDSVNDSRTVSYMRTSNYIGNYVTSRSSSYTRGFLGNFIGNYGRNFAGNYNRTGTYSRNFSGQYSRSSSYSRTIPSSRNFEGNYNRTRVSSYARGVPYIRNSVFTRTRLSYSSGTFTGNYSRTLNIPTAYSRDVDYIGNYQRTRSTTYYVDIGGGDWFEFYVAIAAPSYIGDYTRNFIGNYARYRAQTFTAGVSYTGNYSRNYAGNFSGNYTRAANYSRNFTGNFTGNYGRTLSSSRTFTGDFVGEYSRNIEYNRNRIGSGGTVTSTRTSTGGGGQVTDHFMYGSKSGFRAGWRYTISTGEIKIYKLGSEIASGTGNTNTTEIVFNGVTYQRGTFQSGSSNSIHQYYGVTYNEGTTPYVGDFTTATTYTGNYVSASSYNRTRITNSTGDFTRTSTYNRTRAADRSQSYLGTAEYLRTSTRTRTSSYTRDRAGAESRTVYYEGNYNRTRVANYTRGIYAEFTRTSSRTLYFAGNTPTPTDYTRTRNVSYEGNFTGNYNRDLFYTGGVDYTRGFVGNFGRTRSSSYSRTSAYNRTLTSNRVRVGDYNRELTYSRTRTSTYTRDRQSAAGESYTRNFNGNFVGNYIGNYTRSSSGTSSGVSEVKWRGEQFVMELRVGSAGNALTLGQNDPDSIILDSKTFTLFDNDAGTVLATTGVTVSDTDTTHKLIVDFKSDGNQVASGRVTTLASSVSAIMAGPFDLTDGLNEITVNNAPQVVSGSTVTYYIHVNNNGTSGYWAPGGQYTVTRVPSNDDDGQDPPPDGSPTDSDGTTPGGPTDPGDPSGPGDDNPPAPGSDFE